LFLPFLGVQAHPVFLNDPQSLGKSSLGKALCLPPLPSRVPESLKGRKVGWLSIFLIGTVVTNFSYYQNQNKLYVYLPRPGQALFITECKPHPLGNTGNKLGAVSDLLAVLRRPLKWIAKLPVSSSAPTHGCIHLGPDPKELRHDPDIILIWEATLCSLYSQLLRSKFNIYFSLYSLQCLI
jgi:hypothetical protein